MDTVNESNSSDVRAPPSPVQSGGGAIKRKDSSAAQGCVVRVANQSDRKKTKIADDVMEEVRVLIAQKLMSIDEAVKLQALKDLARIVTTGGQSHPQKEEYYRAIGEWHGCHFVLVVMQQELSKGNQSNREVVLHAIRFVTNWIVKAPHCRDAMSSFKGAKCIVDATQAYPEDREIQYVSICCFSNYTCDRNEARLKEIVEEKAIARVVHAVTKFSGDEQIVTFSVRVLDRLQGASGNKYWQRLVQDGVLTAVSLAIEAHLDAGDHVLTSCFNLMRKLCVP